VDELELIARARQGDQAAYTILVERHRTAVYRLACRTLLNPEDARDVAQEAFIQAYLHLHQLRDDARFGPWVRQITINQCRMWLRRQREIDPHDAVLETTDAAPQVDLRLAVQQALACLSTESRRTIVLYYIHSYSLLEIASHLEVPVTTVKSRLRDARARLRKEMSEMHEEKSESIALPPLVRRLFGEVFEGGNFAVAHEIVAPGFVWHRDGEPLPVGPAVLQVIGERTRSAFPDARFEIYECIEAEGKAAVRWIMRATHLGEYGGMPATGLTVAADGMTMMRIEKGKLTEMWMQFDESSLLQQLGFSAPRAPEDPNNPELPINRILTTIMAYAVKDNAVEIQFDPQPIVATKEFEHEGKIFHTQREGEPIICILFRQQEELYEQMRVPYFISEGLVERFLTRGEIDMPAPTNDVMPSRISIEYGRLRHWNEDGETSWTVAISKVELGERIVLEREAIV